MPADPRRILVAALLALILLVASVGSLTIGADTTEGPQAPALPPSVVGQVIDQVSLAELVAHVCHLQDKEALGYCNAQGSRYSLNQAGLQEAADYIAGELEAHGNLTVTHQPFTPPNFPPDGDEPTVLTNIVGTLAGHAPPAERGIVIVSAHYDSTASRTTGWSSSTDPAPGADDDASGVAAVLEAARLLSERRLRHTVHFITFAGEEQGLHGSRHYADVARQGGDDIVGVVNADMVGYESDGEPWLEIHAGTNPSKVALAHTFSETIHAYYLNLLPHVVLENATRLSDHAPFWDQGYPAILVIEDYLTPPTSDFNPNYHTVEDTLEHIDRAYFLEMARAIAGAVTRLAQPLGPDLRVSQQGPAEAIPGQTVTFTVAYTNAGSAPAAGVVLTETLANGLTYASDNSGVPSSQAGSHVSWALGDVGIGVTGKFLITATIVPRLRGTPSVDARATIGGADLDADSADNVSVVEVLLRRGWEMYLPFLTAEQGFP